jgi:hypothetical protein
MLKGIALENFGNIEMPYFKTSEYVLEQTVLSQDTLKTQPKVLNKPQLNLSKPSLAVPLNSGQSMTSSVYKNLDSIFLRSEQREKAITKQNKVIGPKLEISVNPEDTSSVKIYHPYFAYQHSKTITDIRFQENFLITIPYKSLSEFTDTTILPIKDSIVHRKDVANLNITTPLKKNSTGIDGSLKSESSFNWVAGLLLLSLFVFSWMKILYQKYILQEITALINYQASLRLLREKNVLFKNMSVGLTIVFAINLGLFLYYVLSFFHISQVVTSDFISVLIYCASIAAFYSIKSLLCRLIGYLFLSQPEFSEYVHNITVFNKNTGLLLFPFVVTIPYINDSIKPIILYSGIILFLGIYILRIIRGFQIIIHKGVSSFYLILYLCAVEILPVLLIVKYSSTLI